ncbi:hypothetical protein A3C67_01800 [Candidatus Nomurabacteria bacterium RIFCSPHIGHO2_02_FULL_42_19]|uniref:Uncharacterized protein n=1 Tax=Candidatus Nomurabacteria bacterium RIFCSPHIGHO2_02_FULL_42_19 TaxID=1801756 RepID=A0A1F6W3Q0_9BACT|nr:MAG: hypothetical protein A3C67_01800 [Candidatus Nomurabacteria bacterium RIFCSPHIGHO2_02_FULL_42_19]
MDEFPEVKSNPSTQEILPLDMENFRHEILTFTSGKKGRPISLPNLKQVILAKLVEADARMWYAVNHSPTQITQDIFKEYEKEVRASHNGSRDFFRAALAEILTAKWIEADINRGKQPW